MSDDDLGAKLRADAALAGQKFSPDSPDVQRQLARELRAAGRPVDEPPPGFRIGGEEQEYLSVEFLARQHPECDDRWDGNWLVTRVSIAAGAFRGGYQASLRSDEIDRFLSGLRMLYAPIGAANPAVIVEFSSMEEQLSIRIRGGKRGHLTASCVAEVHSRPRTRLEFTLSFDQAGLRRLIDELSDVLLMYPVKGMQ